MSGNVNKDKNQQLCKGISDDVKRSKKMESRKERIKMKTTEGRRRKKNRKRVRDR